MAATLRRDTALSLVLLLSGCSFLGMRYPSQPPPGGRVDCTESRVPPAIDLTAALVAAGFSVWGLVTGLTAHCGPHDELCPGIAYGIAVVSGVPALVYGGASLYGFKAASACEDAKKEAGDTIRP